MLTWANWRGGETRLEVMQRSHLRWYVQGCRGRRCCSVWSYGMCTYLYSLFGTCTYHITGFFRSWMWYVHVSSLENTECTTVQESTQCCLNVSTGKILQWISKKSFHSFYGCICASMLMFYSLIFSLFVNDNLYTIEMF